MLRQHIILTRKSTFYKKEPLKFHHSLFKPFFKDSEINGKKNKFLVKYFSLIQNYISYTQWVSMLHSWLRVFCIKMVNKGEENNNLEEVTRLLEWDCSSNKYLLNRGTVFAQSLMWWWFVFFVNIAILFRISSNPIWCHRLPE